MAMSVLAACLLVSACGGDQNGGDDGGGEAGESARLLLTAATNAFNGAMDDYVRYYRGEYRSPLPDDVSGEEETISYLVEIQEELLDRLASVRELHAQLGPALENAIDQDAVPSEDIPDFRRYVGVTGDFLALQQVMAEGGRDCLELAPDRVEACALELAIDNQERSDSLALEIEEVAERLFES
ncbi:MAG: hypothetical protein L0206_18885 [Actinobacteria bacterium]|nr:hypothetical protein [Actinomycetota bacterium]